MCACCVFAAALNGCVADGAEDNDADGGAVGGMAGPESPFPFGGGGNGGQDPGPGTQPADGGSSGVTAPSTGGGVTAPSTGGGPPDPIVGHDPDSGPEESPVAGGGGPTGATDTDGATDGATDDIPPIERPPTTEAGQYGDWTYYEVQGALCRDGSPAGYYLREGTVPNLLIFLNGGGVCYDDFFCAINPSNVEYSLPGENLAGATMELILGMLLPVRQEAPDEGIFLRDPRNPVADWSMVFVPYCTGDVHAGTRPDGTVVTSVLLPPQQFVGYHNLGLFYRSFGGDYMNTETVLLAGSSAGGFGALLNYDRTQEFFQNSRVLAITDSGIPFRDQYLEPCLQQNWRDLFGLDAMLPPDCTGCFNDDGGGLAEGLGEYMFHQKYAGRMLGGGISSDQDQIIKLFYSAGLNDCTTITALEAVAAIMLLGSYPLDRYPAGLNDFLDNVAGRQNVGSYLISGDLHQHLFRARYYEQNGVGRTIAEWVGDLLGGQSVHLGSP